MSRSAISEHSSALRASLTICLIALAFQPAYARCRRDVAIAVPALPVALSQAQPAPDIPRPGDSAPNGAGASLPDPTPISADIGPPFSVARGESLRAALTRWAGASGWTLVWDASSDYALGADAEFPGGDLKQAVSKLMESLKSNGAPYGAEMWTGNRVVRVTRVR